jgi:hypothetical protein
MAMKREATMTTTFDPAPLRANLDKLNARDRDFATSLLSQLQSRRALSTAQWHWVGVLSKRATEPRQAPAMATRLPSIHALMTKAAERLSRARITMRGFSVATSRHAGTYYVTDSAGSYLGKIMPDSAFLVSRDAAPRAAEIAAELATLEADPVKAATTYGHETGCCCFCARALTDKRSITAGYGPQCADNYGLTWG